MNKKLADSLIYSISKYIIKFFQVQEINMIWIISIINYFNKFLFDIIKMIMLNDNIVDEDFYWIDIGCSYKICTKIS